MKTEEVIQSLARDLRPVRRLRPPWHRAAFWFASGGLYVTAVVARAWAQQGTLGLESATPYLVQQLALLAMSALAALAAFTSIVPGLIARSQNAAIAAAGVLVGALAWGCLSDVRSSGTLGIGREADWPCVSSIALGAAGLGVLALVMLRRGAVMRPRTTGLLAGVAAVGLANLEACISRAHSFTMTVVVWHGVTSVALVAILMAISPVLLARRAG